MKVQSLDSCFINSNHALEACPKLYQNTQEIFLIRKYYLLTQYKKFLREIDFWIFQVQIKVTMNFAHFWDISTSIMKKMKIILIYAMSYQIVMVVMN